jgi:hypothetical protein
MKLLWSIFLVAMSVSNAHSQIPDFSGQWVHPSLPGFEPPEVGAGPITNRSRLPNGQGNWNQLVGDFTNPILKPNAAEVVKRHGEISLSGATYPTPSNQCWPPGVPYIFSGLAMHMIQRPTEVTIMYRGNQEVRRVRMNSVHPANVLPSWYGDSVGHYEGDTLVVDTVGVRTDRPYAMLDMYGTPFTSALHVVERYRLIDYEATMAAVRRDLKVNAPLGADLDATPDPDYRGPGLQLEFTVEDEGVFTTPWTATITYRRGQGPWREFICAENRRESTGEKETKTPMAERLDF